MEKSKQEKAFEGAHTQDEKVDDGTQYLVPVSCKEALRPSLMVV